MTRKQMIKEINNPMCKCGHREESHFTWLDYGEYNTDCKNVSCKCIVFKEKK